MVLLGKFSGGKRLAKSEKLGYAAAIAMMVVQAIGLYLGAGIWALLAPPLLAAVPLAFSTYRYQRVTRMKAKPRIALLTTAILAAVTACFFFFAPGEPSLRFQLMRAMFLDVTILLVACTPAAFLYHRRASAT
jgi:hypothetical protein